MKKTLAVVYITLVFSFCGKDETIVKKLSMGQTDQVTVKTVNSEKIDINNDGQFDLELLTTLVKAGPAAGPDTKVSLQCLNNSIAIRSEIIKVDRFKNYTITKQTQNNINLKIYESSENCLSLPGATLISTNTIDRFVCLRSGESLSIEAPFLIAKQVIKEPDFKFSEVTVYGDTSYVYTTSSSTCNTLLHDGDNYFGIRLMTQTGVKIGWVKINSANPSVFSQFAISK